MLVVFLFKHIKNMNNKVNNDTFIVNLLSNKSMNFHPKNNSTNFTNQFDKHIEFDKKMEVALFQINFPKIINIPNIEFKLILEESNKEVILLTKRNEENNISTDKEETTLQELNSFCNISIDEIKSLIENYYKPVNMTVKFNELNIPKINFIGKNIYYTKAISEIILTRNESVRENISLYWKIDNIIKDKYHFTYTLKNKMEDDISLSSTNQKKIFNQVSYVYICSDLNESSYIGPQKLNLLRIISKSFLDNQSNSVCFNPLIYIPVKKNIIDSINISLFDENLNLLNCKKGDCSLSLLFRPLEQF